MKSLLKNNQICGIFWSESVSELQVLAVKMCVV